MILITLRSTGAINAQSASLVSIVIKYSPFLIIRFYGILSKRDRGSSSVDNKFPWKYNTDYLTLTLSVGYILIASGTRHLFA